MKIRLATLVLFLIQLNGYSQEVFTSRKGPKFFPAHLDMVITLDNGGVRYELFNHWYTLSYAELRQIKIPLDSLTAFNQKSDSLQIMLHNGRVKLIDKKYRLSRKMGHRNLCASASTMRKIAFACSLVGKQQGIRHFELYDREDLKLDEDEFRKKVIGKLREMTK